MNYDSRIKNAKNLNELCDTINEFREEQPDVYRDYDFSSLPIFGREGYSNTLEIFSWNDSEFLTQDCNGNWIIDDFEI